MEPQAPLAACPIAAPTPFASLLRRAAAFVIDGVMLYMAGYLLNRIARDGLLTLNPWLPWLGNLAALAYFAAAQGPIGKGRTLGKSVMSIVVTDAQGAPLDWVSSLRRTVPQQVAFLVVANPGLYCLAFPPAIRTSAGFALTLVMVLALMFVITLVFSISLHPHKRGWHDMWGGSYVTGDPVSQVFLAALATPLDVLSERKLAHYWKITIVLFIIASVAMAYRPIASMRSAEAQTIRTELTQLQADYPMGPYFLAAVQHPDPQMKKLFLDQVHSERQAAIDAGETAPTTDSLRTHMVNDGETTIIQCLRLNGPFAKADLDDPEIRNSVGNMRANLWAEWPQWLADRRREVADQIGASKDEKVRQQLQDLDDRLSQTDNRNFVVLLFEPFQLLIYTDTQPRGIIRGPADPAQGPLVYEEFSVARMQLPDGTQASRIGPSGVDQAPTTGTQSTPASTASPSVTSAPTATPAATATP